MCICLGGLRYCKRCRYDTEKVENHNRLLFRSECVIACDFLLIIIVHIYGVHMYFDNMHMLCDDQIRRSDLGYPSCQTFIISWC